MANPVKKKLVIAQRSAIIIINGEGPVGNNVAQFIAALGADQAVSSQIGKKSAIGALNDAVMQSSGFAQSGWESFNSDWLASPKASQYVKRAAKVLEAEFDDSYLMLIADPGTARLLPFWNVVFEQFNIVARYVFVVEDPSKLDEDAPLEQRIDAGNGHLVWLRTALNAEYHTRGHLRAFIDPVALGEKPTSAMEKAAKTLDLVFPRNIRAASAANPPCLAALRARALRATKSDSFDAEGAAPSEWVQVAHMTLAQWANETETDEGQYVLDAVREAFDDALPAFRGITDVWPGAARKVEGLEERLEALDRELRAARTEAADARARELAAGKMVEDQKDEVRRQQSDFKHRIAYLESELAQRKAEVDDSERALQGAHQEVASLKHEVTTLRDSTRQEVETLHQALRDANRAKEEAEEQLRDRYREIVTLSRKFATEAAASEAFKRRSERLKLIALTFEEARSTGRLGRLLDRIMPWRWHLARIRKHLEADGTFDCAAYLAANPDVAQAGMEPLRHFLLHGLDENRPLGLK